MNQEQLEKSKNLFFILLGLDIAITVISGFNTYSTLGILKDIQSGTRSFTQDLITSLEFWEKFDLLMILTVIGVGLGLVKWLNSCYRFAKESIGATGFKNEGWTVAAWIIPIFNLFKPYQIINEIYKAGSPNYSGTYNWKKENGSGLLLTWWIFWAVTHFIMWIVVKETFKKSIRNDLTLSQVIGLYEFQILIIIFSILIAVLWFIVAGWLTQRLIERSAKPYNINSSTVHHHDDLYKHAYEEISSGQFETGSWAKAFANAEGNQDKAKALYIKYRVEQLANLEAQKSHVIPVKEDLSNQPETKISVYQQNKGLVAVITVVGFLGIILLASQMQKSSINSSGKSSQSSYGMTETIPQLKPVEQNQPQLLENRYRDNGDGTVTDRQSNLQWMRCALGQEWTGSTCKGKARQYSWLGALNAVDVLNNNGGYGRYQDWRLPMINELKTLVYCSSGNPKIWNNTEKVCQGDYERPTIYQLSFPNTADSVYWSSSPDTNNPDKALFVLFFSGGVGAEFKFYNYYARLVRGGK